MGMGFLGIIFLFFLLLILLMIPAGIVLIVKARKAKSEFPTCGQCGYDLTGSTGATELCPECGGQFTEVGIIPPQPVGRRGQLALGIVLIIVPLSCVGLGVVGTFVSYSSVREVQMQAITNQQQLQVMALTTQQQQLVDELAALSEQLEATTDEAIRSELETEILKLQQELESVEAEIKQVEPEKTGDGE